jgi:cardiolipin synthase
MIPLPATNRGALRDLAEHALSRAAGGPLVLGNAVRVLRNASENYPAWLAALAAAKQHVCFENYIFSDDVTGRRVASALAERARRGVRVRVLYDWLGCLGEGASRIARQLAAAGVEVRAFNPPRFDRPLAWLSRDHRKAIAIDGQVAFVSGLCVSDRWAGDARRGSEEWRDTGVEVRGPAVADVERAFGSTWVAAGGVPIPAGEVTSRGAVPAAGEVAVRVVATEPNEAGLFRLDLLVSGLARRSLFLADAYFFATTPYVEALRAAARDGVDVRLLVPGVSDLWLVSSVSRAGYRPLLETGVRVFEWNGPMMHAKTAVADGRWARVGSSNLNVSSWLGNYELDVTIEDEGVAGDMERYYLADLEQATEVVLRRRGRGAAVVPAVPVTARHAGARADLATAGAIRIGHAVGAALTGQRTLGPAEARVALGGGIVVVALAVAALLWPRLLTVPLAALGLWLGAALLLHAWRLARPRRYVETDGAPAPGQALLGGRADRQGGRRP